MNNTIDISQLSEEQLKAALAEKRKVKEAKEAAERKAYEKDNEDYITAAISKAKHIRNELTGFKKHSIKEANNLFQRMYDINNKPVADQKTFSRISKDQQRKVIVNKQDNLRFTDEAAVHINTIKGIFKEKFEGRNKGFYNILDSLLIKNGKGEYDPKLLAKARRQVRELGDDALIEAFDKLDECQVVEGSSLYCRFYEKDAKGKWQDISLNFSSL